MIEELTATPRPQRSRVTVGVPRSTLKAVIRSACWCCTAGIGSWGLACRWALLRPLMPITKTLKALNVGELLNRLMRRREITNGSTRVSWMFIFCCWFSTHAVTDWLLYHWIQHFAHHHTSIFSPEWVRDECCYHFPTPSRNAPNFSRHVDESSLVILDRMPTEVRGLNIKWMHWRPDMHLWCPNLKTQVEKSHMRRW